ncbi:MAG: DUF5693 family protein [Clostridia bacterium]
MKADKILITVLVLSLTVAAFTLYQRSRVEEPYYRVELVADYEQYKELADDMGMPMDHLLEELRDVGVTSVAIKEETLEKLRADGLISVMNLWELMEQDLLRHPLNEVASKIKGSDLDPSGTVVVFAADADTYRRIRQPLKARSRAFHDWSEGGIYAMTVSGRYEDLKELAIVFDYDKFEMAQELGLGITARPSNYRGITSRYIEGLFESFNKYPVTSLVFDGQQVLGYPDELETTARMIKKTGIVLGPIETWMQLKHIKQLGLDSLIQLADFRAARVFSLNEEEADKVSPREVMDRWFRAVDERNARIVYLKPKLEEEKDPEDNFETNREYIEEFAGLISRRGFERAAVVPMRAFNIGRLRLLALAAGMVAGAAILIDDLINIRKKYLYGFFVLGVAGCFGLQLVVPSIADKVFALGAAVVFPSLAMLYVLRYCEKALKSSIQRDLKDIICGSVLLLLKASLISLIGAAYVASMLSSTQYLLEMDIFRGVKIAHIIPLLVFTAAYFIVIGYRRDEHRNLERELRSLMDTPLFVKYAVLLGMVAVAGYLYLGRTGHTAGAPIFGIEAHIRTFMEQTLPARPRTKEFLVAHPAFILLAAAAMTRVEALLLPLGLAAAIGQVSMVNSFSHLRTPLYISFYRTVYGLGFGIVLGVIGVLVMGGIIKFFAAHRRT